MSDRVSKPLAFTLARPKARSDRRVALLGAGSIAKFHVEALRAAPGVQLAAACDLSPSKADTFARSHGIPKAYASLETMLAEEKLDAVHVLLPSELHGAAVLRLLEAGIDVLSERPLATSASECKQLTQKAEELGRKLGVSHNFLFSPNYEQFAADLRTSRFGRINHIDIVWNKELAELNDVPLGGFLFARPEHVLFELGPHSLGQVAHLLGGIEDLTVSPRDRIELPGGREFFRRWEILGWRGSTSVRLRFAFIDGFSQHYIQVRGSAAAATVDFEQGTYLITEHTAKTPDVDRYAAATTLAARSVLQASETLGRHVLSKLGLTQEGAPFQRSITRSVRAFYQGVEAGELDERLGGALATRTVELAELVRDAAKMGGNKKKKPAVGVAPPPRVLSGVPETVLVLGGTGFIGRALVRKLREAGYGVRLLVRDPSAVPAELKQLGVGVARGDLADTRSIEAALGGIQQIYHLAAGQGETWEDYVRTDIEPTKRLAELCLAKGIKRLYYTSSIAIYHSGKSAGTITEDTQPHPGVLRTDLGSRAKVEIEKLLLDMHKTRGLGVVLFRPGIVLGPGGHPLHVGIAGWPFSSVPRLYGAGNNPLPIVLVDDCAQAMVLAQKVQGIEGESFNIVGEANITAQQYLDELERAAGVKFTRVPTSVLRYLVEDIGKYVLKTVGRDPARELPSYANWDRRTYGARFDATRARQKLDWHPTTDRENIIHEGIARPAAQFLA